MFSFHWKELRLEGFEDLQHPNRSNVTTSRLLSASGNTEFLCIEVPQMSYRLGWSEEGIKLLWQPIRPGFDTLGSPRRLCLVSIKSTLILYLYVDTMCTLNKCVCVSVWGMEDDGEQKNERGRVWHLSGFLSLRFFQPTDLETNNVFTAYKDFFLFDAFQLCKHKHVMDFNKAIKSADRPKKPCCFFFGGTNSPGFTKNLRWTHKSTPEQDITGFNLPFISSTGQLSLTPFMQQCPVAIYGSKERQHKGSLWSFRLPVALWSCFHEWF